MLDVKNAVVDLVDKISKGVIKYTPEILAGTGIACFIGSTVAAVKATPEANKRVEAKKAETKKETLTVRENLNCTWKLYLPAVALGAAGTGFVVMSVCSSNKRYLALSTSYSLLKDFTNSYQSHVVETIGERKEKKIRDEIAQEKVDKDEAAAPVIITNTGNTLFKESLTGQRFRGDINKVKNLAIEFANKEFGCPEGYFGAGEWLDALGLEVPETMHDLGWSVSDQGKALTIDFTACVDHKNNDEPCLVINYYPMPLSDYAKYY